MQEAVAMVATDQFALDDAKPVFKITSVVFFLPNYKPAHVS
jgi:hypothetical protein